MPNNNKNSGSIPSSSNVADSTAVDSTSVKSSAVGAPQMHQYLGQSHDDVFEIDQDGDQESDQERNASQPSSALKSAKSGKTGKTGKTGKPRKTAKTGKADDLDEENDENEESNPSDEDEALEALLSDMDEDYSESELEELEALQEELHARAAQPSMTLANKLATVGHDFPVTGTVPYSAKLWPLPHGAHAHPNNIRFDRALSGSNDLKRALAYHTIPEFSPFSYIRSNSTAKIFGNEYSILEQYIFIDNGISARPEHIALISVPMINQAFEKAKAATSKHHYYALFKHLRFWARLSEQKLLPEDLRLDVSAEHIDLPERRSDVVRSRFNGALESWIAYSEEDMEILMDYSMFWLEKVMPKAKLLKDYLVDTSFAFLSDLVVTRRERIPELEALCTIEIDGKTVMSPRVRPHKKDGLQHYSYSWVTEYGRVLDGIRNSIFILVALVTGARKGELAAMNFSHVSQEANGDYWLAITRWKTAASPKHGEEDRLPLPKFVGDMIRAYEELRSIPPFTKEGWLFQPMRSRKVVNRATPSAITSVIEQLKLVLPIERLHCHRFRKTIAEILINRDERNIDIIRALFGHKSYAMTLRYIARNPLMVRSVAIAIEQNYTREFQDIVAGLRLGYSGASAERIYKQIIKRPDEFAGQQLKVTLVTYISHLLKAGEPLFIRRTAVGTYCLSGEHFTPTNLPPCLAGRNVESELIMPNPSNCKIECKKVVMLSSAKQALSDNIKFYEAVLDKSRGKLAATAEAELLRRISSSEFHLNNLITSGHSTSQQIEVRNV